MPRTVNKGHGCPICGGPDDYDGARVEGWIEVYHGPEGHTIAILDGKTGKWREYAMTDVCGCCVASHSLADWTGKRFLLKKKWYDDGGALAIAGDAICAGHTRPEASAMSGLSVSTIYRRLKHCAEKHRPRK